MIKMLLNFCNVNSATMNKDLLIIDWFGRQEKFALSFISRCFESNYITCIFILKLGSGNNSNSSCSIKTTTTASTAATLSIPLPPPTPPPPTSTTTTTTYATIDYKSKSIEINNASNRKKQTPTTHFHRYHHY